MHIRKRLLATICSAFFAEGGGAMPQQGLVLCLLCILFNYTLLWEGVASTKKKKKVPTSQITHRNKLALRVAIVFRNFCTFCFVIVCKIIINNWLYRGACKLFILILNQCYITTLIIQYLCTVSVILRLLLTINIHKSLFIILSIIISVLQRTNQYYITNANNINALKFRWYVSNRG